MTITYAHLRNFLTVLNAVIDALNHNQDMTPALMVELDGLPELHSWCPPEGTQPWDQVRDLLRTTFGKDHPRVANYKRILSYSGVRRISPSGLGGNRPAPEVVQELEAAMKTNGDFSDAWGKRFRTMLKLATVVPRSHSPHGIPRHCAYRVKKKCAYVTL